MKKILIAIALLLSLNVSNASFGSKSKEKASTEQTSANPNHSKETSENPNPGDEATPDEKAQKKALMEKVSKMSVKEYEGITGKKMNFIDRLTFKAIKSRFAQKLNAADDTEGFNIGGFILGLLLGLIGVLGAYIFSKDRNFRKWTWIGWGVFVVVYLIILLV